jgi:FkbM family methyltransferase
VLGRRNAVRLTRYLLDQARLDVPNEMESNGELLIQRGIVKHATGDLIVIDVGAHYGEWSSRLIEHVSGSGRALELHVFEPAEFSFARLHRSLPQEPNVTVHFSQKALSSRSGWSDLAMAHHGAGSASLHEGHPGALENAVRERVELVKLDDYVETVGITHLDLLKIDAEGHDIDVLAGATNMLERGGVSAVQFEYTHRWIGARRFLRDAFELLGAAGYVLGKVTPRGVEFYSGWDWELESYREANYVALLPEVRDWFPSVRWWKDRNSAGFDAA